MADPRTNPRQFLIEAVLSPDDPHLEATPVALSVIDGEIGRLKGAIASLEACFGNLAARMKAGKKRA